MPGPRPTRSCSTARSAGLQLLQRARDEAHRFALGFHRSRRGAGGGRLDLRQPARRRAGAPEAPHGALRDGRGAREREPRRARVGAGAAGQGRPGASTPRSTAPIELRPVARRQRGMRRIALVAAVLAGLAGVRRRARRRAHASCIFVVVWHDRVYFAAGEPPETLPQPGRRCAVPWSRTATTPARLAQPPTPVAARRIAGVSPASRSSSATPCSSRSATSRRSRAS